MREIKSLIGNVYSRLTVVSRGVDRIPPNGKRKVYWNCLCECGNEVEVRQDGLTGGGTKSCGCLHKEVSSALGKMSTNRPVRKLPSLVGNSYGLLTVISAAEPSVTPKGRKLPRWNCECSCGNTYDILHEELRKGFNISCGCVSKKYFDMGCRSANEEFLLKARAVHGDLYQYTNVEYTHSQEYISITCNKHGEFQQWPSNHLQGTGCPDCNIESRRHTPESFMSKVKEVHGDLYDYSNTDFKSRLEHIEVVCPIHGLFTIRPSDHLCGRGCQQCGFERRFVGLESFIERSNEIHNFKFDYSEVFYEHSNVKVKIICDKHGPFMQQPSGHLLGQQCPKCAGEERAEKQHWNYIKRCELNPEMARGPGTLYLLEMKVGHENFLKVGISTEYKKRLGRYTEAGIDFNILKVIETTTLQSAIFESQVLKFVSKNGIRYIPDHQFKGWTECATVDSKELLINYYEELNVGLFISTCVPQAELVSL